mmetsp:Transcript_8980/g.20017  ORF Transcript_8980/g.20017 Transcript_8980/m.20017 type:complete len:109 (+) Transcript_8980:61-387(+)
MSSNSAPPGQGEATSAASSSSHRTEKLSPAEAARLRFVNSQHVAPKNIITDLPLWRRIGAEWGGLIWFGAACGVCWLMKKYTEFQYASIERELDKPRRLRDPKYQGDL